MSQVDILAVFAHPDDVELTVGGTLLKMKHLGYRTGALDVTAGEMGTRGPVEGRAEEAETSTKKWKLSVRMARSFTIQTQTNPRRGSLPRDFSTSLKPARATSVRS